MKHTQKFYSVRCFLKKNYFYSKVDLKVQELATVILFILYYSHFFWKSKLIENHILNFKKLCMFNRLWSEFWIQINSAENFNNLEVNLNC
jgi:hypothetical protein